MTSVAGEEVKAFVPYPLPPKNPQFELSATVERLQISANEKLAALRVASTLLPNVNMFAYAFVRNEAVYSSQIEGVQATLDDLLNFEAAPEEFKGNEDVVEVCNYLDALSYGNSQLRNLKGLPLSLRLLRETHRRLMKGVRGASKNPGEFRATQNWIGGSRPGTAHFVPPPPKEMKACLENLEGFLHIRESTLAPLIRIGLAHVQFETIHPFLDGNGRVGRLLIALLLQAWLELDSRLLYLSLYFKQNQQEYYKRLDSVRSHGDWEGWVEFFLKGVCHTAQLGIEIAQGLYKQFEGDRKKLLASSTASIPAIRLFEELPSHPIVAVSAATELLKVTKPTAGSAIDLLCQLGILEERTGAKRNRLFGYRKYLQLLRAE